MTDSMIRIALIDAATNCVRDGAVAVLTIRGGVQVVGELERPRLEATTAHVKTTGGGWATVLIDEIVVIEARKK